jgi:hypothetical protein
MVKEKKRGTKQVKWKKLNQSNWLEGYYKLKIRLLKNALKEYTQALKKLQRQKSD